MNTAAAAAAFAAAEAAARDASEAETLGRDDQIDPNISMNEALLMDTNSHLMSAFSHTLAPNDGLVGEDTDICNNFENMMHTNIEICTDLHSQMNPFLQEATSNDHLEQHQRDLQQQLAMAAAVAAAAGVMETRPTDHDLRMLHNGTILEITNTLIGYAPQSMQFTSSYDTIHFDDVTGYTSIIDRYWEHGKSDVESYFRRRNKEGEWIWVVASLVDIIEHPIPHFHIHERIADDPVKAKMISRAIRISSILLNVIEKKEKNLDGPSKSDVIGDANIASNSNTDEIIALGDVAALQSYMTSRMDKNGNSYSLHELQQMIEVSKNDNNQEKSMANEVDSAITLNMTKVKLTRDEVKLSTLVCSGRLDHKELAPLILGALKRGGNLGSAIKDFKMEIETKRENDERVKLFARSKEIDSHTRRNRNASRDMESSSRLTHSGSRNKLISRTGNPSKQLTPPPIISSINLSYTYIGNYGLEMFCETLWLSPHLRKLDISFCGVDERGFLSFSRAIKRRKKKKFADIHELILSGNIVSIKAAKALGVALSSTLPEREGDRRKVKKFSGFDDDEDEEDEEDEYEKDSIICNENRKKIKNNDSNEKSTSGQNDNFAEGLSRLHLGCSSLTPEALNQFLNGLGRDCPIRELCLSSNNFGLTGANVLVSFLEGKGRGSQKHKGRQPVMPRLDCLDLSNNNLGNDGTAKLTSAILFREKVKLNIVTIKLTSNGIGASGIETVMNKLLEHNLVSLSLDNNNICDRGCQLVAASLPSMHHLSRLNLSFNQIGSRGTSALMRALLGCQSMTYLGVSGNVMRVSGAIAMGYALSHHPRLAELDVDNCCLSQVAQCHIVAGIISNRWVPMKKMNGFQVGPPMVFIGALDLIGQHMSNVECFSMRRDAQMRETLQFMQQENISCDQFSNEDVDDFLSKRPDTQMKDWLSRIPFDEDELIDLRKHFFDAEGGESADEENDGRINLKHRGDLLAALGSKVIEEIRDTNPKVEIMDTVISNIGLDIFEKDQSEKINADLSEVQYSLNESTKMNPPNPEEVMQHIENFDSDEDHALDNGVLENGNSNRKRKKANSGSVHESSSCRRVQNDELTSHSLKLEGTGLTTLKPLVRSSRTSVLSDKSDPCKTEESSTKSATNTKKKSRISMFPDAAAKLELLKNIAQQSMDMEQDAQKQDLIAQQFAESSLVLLRQLRYECMNKGLDGWRQKTNGRKVLIVDDSKVTRKLVSRHFEKANFIVDTAENGEKGVEKMKQNIYDIAFMDINMPVMNGFDATKALREWEDSQRPGARQPICALTAAIVDDFERTELMKYKEAGVDVMESKPCNIPRLFKAVDDVSPMFSDLSINVSAQAVT